MKLSREPRPLRRDGGAGTAALAAGPTHVLNNSTTTSQIQAPVNSQSTERPVTPATPTVLTERQEVGDQRGFKGRVEKSNAQTRNEVIGALGKHVARSGRHATERPLASGHEPHGLQVMHTPRKGDQTNHHDSAVDRLGFANSLVNTAALDLDRRGNYNPGPGAIEHAVHRALADPALVFQGDELARAGEYLERTKEAGAPASLEASVEKKFKRQLKERRPIRSRLKALAQREGERHQTHIRNKRRASQHRVIDLTGYGEEFADFDHGLPTSSNFEIQGSQAARAASREILENKGKDAFMAKLIVDLRNQALATWETEQSRLHAEETAEALKAAEIAGFHARQSLNAALTNLENAREIALEAAFTARELDA